MLFIVFVSNVNKQQQIAHGTASGRQMSQDGFPVSTLYYSVLAGPNLSALWFAMIYLINIGCV